MMSWWVWLIISVPVYLVSGGFFSEFVHGHPRHNKEKCDSGERMPCFLWAGVGWPLMLPLLLVSLLWATGETLEKQRPVRRRERREINRQRDLRSIP